MKRALIMIFCLSLLAIADICQASLIQIFDFNGSYDASIGSTQSFDISFGDYNPVSLGMIDDMNSRVNISDGYGAKTLIDIFQRTFIPLPPIYQDEWTYMYNNNRLYGEIRFAGIDDYLFSTFFNFSPIPDLSSYRINALYLDNTFSTVGNREIYDIQLLADVSSVPEPSTFLLLGIGLVSVAVLRRSCRHTVN